MEFDTEPYDLVAEMPKFAWPTVVISGGRDLTTPPAVAHRIASLVPDAVLVELPTAGHSVLDTRERAALEIVKAVRTTSIAEPARHWRRNSMQAARATAVRACWYGRSPRRRSSNRRCPPRCRAVRRVTAS